MRGRCRCRRQAVRGFSPLTFAVFVVFVGLAGCGGGSDGGSAGAPISGGVFAGGPQNPIVGSTITFFAAGAAGYGTGASVLATASSDSSGSFNIGAYTCPSAGTQTYITASGGNPGGGRNAAIGLMALTGQCGNLTASSFVMINELTTVAAQWALAQYIDSTGQIIGTSLTNLKGLNNAINLTNNELLVSYMLSDGDPNNTGVPASFLPTAADCSSGSPPINCDGLERLDTLANVIASCVNSSGPSSTQCQQLFCGATPGASWNGASCSVTPTPDDTLEATHAVVTHPTSNASTIYTVPPPPGMTLFKPVLTSGPADWTLALNYTGGGLNGPLGIAIDASGSAWVANNSTDSITKFTSSGAAISPAGGFIGGGLNNPLGIALDKVSNVWIANNGGAINGGPKGHSSVTELDQNGSPLSGPSGFAAANLTSAVGVAVDLSGLIWVTDNGGNSVIELCGSIPEACPIHSPSYNTGDVISNPSYTGGGLNNPAFIAIDSLNLVWVANNGFGGGTGSSLSELCGSTIGNCPAGAHATGDPISGANGYGGGGLLAPLGVAVDRSDNIWLANTGNSTVSEFCGAVTANCPLEIPSLSTGDPISPAAGYSGGGVNSPIGIAIDSAGFVWVANSANNSMSELSSSGSPLSAPTGYTDGGLDGPAGIAVDGSGNIWLSNSRGNTVTEFLGLARPVKSPIMGPPQAP
ncbi:MAG: hypothetical protein JO189_23625 [Deltaproteobacteria bacterium]|nr:hypothetical protein [Deltaproteobacteria bacterium]